MEEHGITQHVNVHTHTQGNSNIIIDLVLTNRPDLIKKLSVVDGVADHNTILIDINISPRRKCRPKRNIFIRNKADNASILKHLDNSYFILNDNTTVNDKWNIVTSEATNINTYVPHFLISSRHNLPWFAKNLKKLCKRKQRLYNKAKKTRNQDDWQEFCDIRENVHKQQLRSVRVSHISQFLTTSITDKPKSLWTFISKLRQDNQGIGDLHVSGSIVSDDVLKAEALNEQFNSVYTEEGSIPLPNLGESPYGKIERLHISISGVLDQLNKLNPSNAQGPDGIPPWFLNTYAAQLAPILHNIFQLSVYSSQVLQAWKNANVRAIFKKGSRTEAANYRPISLTSVASKLLEHIIHSHVMKHLELHNILTDSQHGFRDKRSTETQLIQTMHDISKSLDKKETVDMAILDFTKASPSQKTYS